MGKWVRVRIHQSLQPLRFVQSFNPKWAQWPTVLYSAWQLPFVNVWSIRWTFIEESSDVCMNIGFYKANQALSTCSSTDNMIWIHERRAKTRSEGEVRGHVEWEIDRLQRRKNKVPDRLLRKATKQACFHFRVRGTFRRLHLLLRRLNEALCECKSNCEN